jgi:hypothetical protein
VDSAGEKRVVAGVRGCASVTDKCVWSQCSFFGIAKRLDKLKARIQSRTVLDRNGNAEIGSSDGTL